MKISLVAAGAAAIIALGTVAANAQAFSDGNFATPDGLPIGTTKYVNKLGGTSIGPWQVLTADRDVTPGVDYIGPTYFSGAGANAGVYSVDLNGTAAQGPDGISQTFTTITGESYH